MWMVTFADMITLLLAFFVLILSFSDLNVNRFKDLPADATFYSFGFFAATTAFLGVLYMYWATLNVFQTLSLLAPLSLALIYFGRRTLHDSFYLHKK